MKPVTVVGGGLAGLTLGILLRQRNVPVRVVEAGSYPRHKVCGEFVSGSGIGVLREAGMLEFLERLGARWAASASFFGGFDSSGELPLPRPALCLSRFSMDRELARLFVEAGGELRTGSRWRGNERAEGLVIASGRRGGPAVNGRRWIGLKAHTRNVALDTDLEMHLVPGGYVGLCPVEDGWFNVCGCFRVEAAVPDLADRWQHWLRGEEDSVLRERLGRSEFDRSSFRAATAFDLKPQAARPDCCVLGDALTMIPPMTGNGMSMAFEAAGLAAPELADYSAGRHPWGEACAEIASRLNRRWTLRLQSARLLHGLVFHAAGREFLLGGLRSIPASWPLLFRLSRG